MEVALSRDNDGPESARVTKILPDKNDISIGTSKDIPLLDSRFYEVKYMDRHTAFLSTNSSAQNMFAQDDEEGDRHTLLSPIADIRTDSKKLMQQNTFITLKKMRDVVKKKRRKDGKS